MLPIYYSTLSDKEHSAKLFYFESQWAKSKEIECLQSFTPSHVGIQALLESFSFKSTYFEPTDGRQLSNN